MSYVAWMRLISWKIEACPGQYQLSAFSEIDGTEDAEREDAYWLQYYERGRSGWGGIDDDFGPGLEDPEYGWSEGDAAEDANETNATIQVAIG